MRKIPLLALVLTLPSLAACASQWTKVRELGATDLSCPAEQLELYRAEGGLLVAKGCGHWTAYACFHERGRIVCMHDAAAVVHPIAEQP
jgi:hypothetical protein